MKKILTLAVLVAATSMSFAQGTANFVNSGSTLISANGTSMLSRNNGGLYYFAIFIAPSTTTGAAGQSALFTAPEFQTVGAYNTNSLTANGALVNRAALDVGTPTANGSGSTIDFIVRGWSANAGTTWGAALAFWNNGNPSETMYMGSTAIGNNFQLGGGAVSAATRFGAGAAQVTGFNMVQFNPVPEPTSMALAGIGAASLLIFRRRK